jgi:AraC family transcriptional regulator, transcriptional activator of pobA
MIPTHNSEKTNRREIIVNRLSTLNEYDFSEPHRHNYFEFFCFIEGGGNHVIDFKKLPIKSNSIHIVAPGQVHQVNRELDSNGFVYLFELQSINGPSEIMDFLFDHICYGVDEIHPTYDINDRDHEAFKMLTDIIWNAQEGKSNLNHLLIQNAIQSLCIKCMELKGDNGVKAKSEYSEFRKLLFKEFREVKKVKEYADRLNITEKALNEIVKKQTGNSTSQIIYNQIILEAKRLLQTGMSAKEVAYDLNFDDPAHFSKFFKSKTNLSPSEFRKVHV